MIPTTGPKRTLPNDEITDLFKEKTFNLVSAIPKDIKIKNIVAYISRNDVFSIKTGNSKSK